MNLHVWTILISAFGRLKCDRGTVKNYDMGCDCGKRTFDEKKEKECLDSALLEQEEDVGESAHIHLS